MKDKRTHLNAASRLVTAAQTVTAADVTTKLVYASGFRKTWMGAREDTLKLKTKASGTIEVTDDIEAAEEGIDDGDLKALQHDHPSIALMVGGKKTLLTWNEAYNLADILLHLATLEMRGGDDEV